MDDKTDLAKFIAPVRDRMLATVWRILRNPQDAEDALQNALVTIWQRRTQIESHPAPHALILRICADAAIDHFRSRRLNHVDVSQLEERLAASDLSPLDGWVRFTVHIPDGVPAPENFKAPETWFSNQHQVMACKSGDRPSFRDLARNEIRHYIPHTNSVTIESTRDEQIAEFADIETLRQLVSSEGKVDLIYRNLPFKLWAVFKPRFRKKVIAGLSSNSNAGIPNVRLAIFV